MRFHVVAPIVTTGVLALVLWRGFALVSAGGAGFWGLIVGTYVMFAGLAAAWAAREHELDFLAPSWGDITRGFFAAAAMFGAAYVGFKLVIEGSPREAWVTRVYLQLGDVASLRAKLGLVCAVIFVACAAEEIVWRGFVTRALERTLGSRAWVASAGLYALAHVPTMFALRTSSLNPALVVAALFMGLATGALTRACEDRVAPAIVAHALFDIAVALVFRLVGTSV